MRERLFENWSNVSHKILTMKPREKNSIFYFISFLEMVKFELNGYNKFWFFFNYS